LINKGSSICSILFYIGRYYRGRVTYIETFNAVLAEDISQIYARIVSMLMPPISAVFLDEVERVHEKMYVVFYNCYFAKTVMRYRPIWLKTDAATFTEGNECYEEVKNEDKLKSLQ
jgi:hypothetical protein